MYSYTHAWVHAHIYIHTYIRAMTSLTPYNRTIYNCMYMHLDSCSRNWINKNDNSKPFKHACMVQSVHVETQNERQNSLWVYTTINTFYLQHVHNFNNTTRHTHCSTFSLTYLLLYTNFLHTLICARWPYICHLYILIILLSPSKPAHPRTERQETTGKHRGQAHV